MDFPPVTSAHPSHFRIVPKPLSTDIKYIQSVFYNSKYLYAKDPLDNVGRFSYQDTPDARCEFKFHSLTDEGPIIPTNIDENQAPEKYYQYHIFTSKGKALKMTDTPDVNGLYLTQVVRDFDDGAQKFYFRKSRTPSELFPVDPFTYNMYMVNSPGTMLCFDDTGLIDVRTSAGPWEELSIEPSTNGDHWGRFKIVSYEFGYRLRAKEDGSILLVANTAETSEDYFSFLPAFPPYTLSEKDSAQKKPLNASEQTVQKVTKSNNDAAKPELTKEILPERCFYVTTSKVRVLNLTSEANTNGLYLTQVANSGSAAQKFSFLRVRGPCNNTQYDPNTYKIYLKSVSSESDTETALSLEDDGSITSKQVVRGQFGGVTEEFALIPSTKNEYKGFKIVSFDSGCRLRARENGVIQFVKNDEELAEDYFDLVDTTTTIE